MSNKVPKKEEELVNTPAPEGQGTVTVAKEVWDQVMKRLELVERATDKGRLSDAENQLLGEKPLIYTVKLRRLKLPDGGFTPIVIAWSNMLSNEARVDSYNRYSENQTTEVFYEDGKKEALPWLDLDDRRKDLTLIAEIVERTMTRDREEMLKVQLSDGRELIINSRFVN